MSAIHLELLGGVLVVLFLERFRRIEPRIDSPVASTVGPDMNRAGVQAIGNPIGKLRLTVVAQSVDVPNDEVVGRGRALRVAEEEMFGADLRPLPT